MRTLVWLALLTAFLASSAQAGSPSFPWHSHTARPVGHVPVRALSRPATSPVEMIPAKQAYPYGWFGPKPTKHPQRSFGSSKNYTQWSW